MPTAKAASKASNDTPHEGKLKEEPSIFEGFAGTRNFSFFSAPAWVDLSKPPGTTSQKQVYGNNPDWFSLLSGKILLFSPNLIWLLAALIVYFVFPYPYNDIPVAATFALDWIAYRACVTTVAVLSFLGFWHTALYYLGLGERPFKADREYRFSKSCTTCIIPFWGHCNGRFGR